MFILPASKANETHERDRQTERQREQVAYRKRQSNNNQRKFHDKT